jgi:hypothetical protein
MSKTRTWLVVLAWSHVLELLDLFSRGSTFWRTRLRLKFFGGAATGIEGRVTYIDGDIDSFGWKCNIRSLH